MRPYVDGVQETTANKTGTLLTVDRHVYAGAEVDNGTPVGYLKGTMDDLRVYNRGLTASEVSTLYTSDVASFVYDGDGNRVRKSEGGSTVVYVNKYYEKNVTSSEVTTYYYLGDKLVALRKGSTVEYTHEDHLGGNVLSTDTAGAQKSALKYLPYGGTRSSSGTLGTNREFTGQRLDGTGLYFYNARYYDPGIGRFVSADTVVGDLTNPQALNRYTYVLNNPVRYTDPTGHFWDTLFDLASFAYDALRVFKNPTSLSRWGDLVIDAGFLLAPGVPNFKAFFRATSKVHDLATARRLARSGDALHRLAILNDAGAAGSKEAADAAKKLGFREFKKGDAFRDNLKRLTGVDPPKNIEAHHVLPQQFEKNFNEAGLNIHDPRLGAWAQGGGEHQRWSHQYNAEWQELFDGLKAQGVNLKDARERILDEAQRLAERYRDQFEWRRPP